MKERVGKGRLLRSCVMALCIFGAISAFGADDARFPATQKGWPERIQTINYLVSVDQSQHPMLVHTA